MDSFGYSNWLVEEQSKSKYERNVSVQQVVGIRNWLGAGKSTCVSIRSVSCLSFEVEVFIPFLLLLG